MLPAGGRLFFLRSDVSAAISSSRRRSSRSPIGRGTSIPASTFPRAAPGCSWCRETGTKARRTTPAVGSPRLRNRSAYPAATAVSSTSLTVAPWAWATFFVTSREVRTILSRRSEPILRLTLVRGAHPAAKTSRAAGHERRRPRAVVMGFATAENVRSSSPSLRRRWSRNSPRVDGSRSGTHGGGLISDGSATGSTNAPSVATPATPSAIAWCILMKNPTRLSGRPVKNHISHKGRPRWSGSCAAPRRR
jgi:hypothetical protein